MHPDKEEQTEPRMVKVYASQGPLRASAARAKLESLGIPAMLSYEPVGRVMGLTFDGIGEVRVLVSESYAVQARDILAEEWPEDGQSPVEETAGDDL